MILPMILVVITCSVQAQNQDTVSLFECHRSAMTSHPLSVQKDLYMQSRELNLKNHSVNWYPSLDLNGRYTWQNEVVQIPFADMLLFQGVIAFELFAAYRISNLSEII